MVNLGEVQFVKRVVVGSDNPARATSTAEIEAAMELVNRCLSEPPRGTIVGIEKSFIVMQAGEHQIVREWLVYHIGFPRKPIWLD